jgi:hypothetical protein
MWDLTAVLHTAGNHPFWIPAASGHGGFISATVVTGDSARLLAPGSRRGRADGAVGARHASSDCGPASVRDDASCCGQVTAITVPPTAS